MMIQILLIVLMVVSSQAHVTMNPNWGGKSGTYYHTSARVSRRFLRLANSLKEKKVSKRDNIYINMHRSMKKNVSQSSSTIIFQ